MKAICASVPRYARPVAVLLAALVPFDASAKDLDLLTRLLIPGYIAQDFAAVCGTYDPHFLPEMNGGSAAVAAYAQHLKIEITSGLTQADAMTTMIAAANTALAIARQQMRALGGKEAPDFAAVKIRAWCESSAKPYILDVVRAHINRHSKFDKIVADAKR